MARELTCKEIYMNRQRAFSHAMGALRNLTRKAHPETGGDALCINNWGNDEARRLERHVWARWQRYSAMSDAAYDLAQHREHEQEGRVGAYLWCQHCKPFQAAYDAAHRNPRKAA